MGNRVGVIFHEDWENFSPIMYSHFGAESTIIKLKKFLKDYVSKYNLENNDGHLYNPCHIMVGFLQSIDKDIHIRVSNLNENQIKRLQEEKSYPNCFDGGCWIVNISIKNFGETICGSNFILENNNIVYDELKDKYDLY